jgi:hypothetical protein
VRIAGAPVTERDAREIITTLVSDGTPHALDLANRITTCLELNTRDMELNVYERNTLLAVLESPPDSLAMLRDMLLSDDRDEDV